MKSTSVGSEVCGNHFYLLLNFTSEVLLNLTAYTVLLLQETREIKNREVVNRHYAGGVMLPPTQQSFTPRR